MIRYRWMRIFQEIWLIHIHARPIWKLKTVIMPFITCQSVTGNQMQVTHRLPRSHVQLLMKQKQHVQLLGRRYQDRGCPKTKQRRKTVYQWGRRDNLKPVSLTMDRISQPATNGLRVWPDQHNLHLQRWWLRHSPADRNDRPKLELSKAREPLGSGGSCCISENTSSHNFVSHGNKIDCA